MLPIDLSHVSNTLTRLATEQLIVRVVICGHHLFPECRVEVMSTFKEVGRDRCGFIHIKSEFYWNNERPYGVTSGFTFDTNCRPEAEWNEGQGFFKDVDEVVQYWLRNITQENSATPQAEWLVRKPFVGMLLPQRGSPSTQRLDLPKDARPLLGYLGLMFSQLSSRADTFAQQESWSATNAWQATIMRQVQTRFESFFVQVQQAQFMRALEAV